MIAEVASLNQDIRGESREMDTLMMNQDRLRKFQVTLQTELLTKEKRAGRAEFAINGIENADFGDKADVNPVLQQGPYGDDVGVEVLHHGGFERLDLLDTGLQVPPGGKNAVVPKMRASPKKEVRLQGASEGEGTEQRETDRTEEAKVPGGGGGLKGDLQNVCDFAFALRKIVLFEFGESGIERRFVELESLRKTSREKIMNEAAKMFGGAGVTGTQKPWRALGKKKLTVLVRERIRKIAAQWFELGQTEAKQG